MPPIFSHAVAVGVAVAASVGLYVLVLFLYVRLGDGRKRGDYPFKDRYLREPGHTLEKNLRGLDQRVVLHCAVAAFLPLPALEVL